MKHYTDRTNIHCELFRDYEGQDEVLKAIIEWWQGIEHEGTAPVIHAVNLMSDEDGWGATVAWGDITEEEQKAIETEFLKLRPLEKVLTVQDN